MDAVTMDLNRYQGQVDAEAARELSEERDWPDLKTDVVERLLLRHSIRIRDHRGERCLADWVTVCEEAACDELMERAQMIAQEDPAEAGLLLREAQRQAAERITEANRDDLLEDYWRGVQEENELGRYGV